VPGSEAFAVWPRAGLRTQGLVRKAAPLCSGNTVIERLDEATVLCPRRELSSRHDTGLSVAQMKRCKREQSHETLGGKGGA